MSRERQPILTVQERLRRDTEANQRLATIGAEPQATGGTTALGEGLTRRGSDQFFGRDARKGTYIPQGRPTPEPSIFTNLVQSIRYIPIYTDDLPCHLGTFTRWFNVFSRDRGWREPIWGQQVDRNDVFYTAAHQAKILKKNLEVTVELLEEDIERLDIAKQEIEALLPDNYQPPWTEDEETGLLWNNLDGYTADLERPHYV